MPENHKKARIYADVITTLHFAWTILLVFGAIFMVSNPFFAPYEIVIMTLTIVVNFPFRGNCPLTVLEEKLRKKIDPEYHNQNSFMTTYLNKIFGTNLKVRTVNTFTTLFYIAIYTSAILLMVHK